MAEQKKEKHGKLDAALGDLHDCFRITAPQMLDIAEKFHGAMSAGLGRKGPLKMLPSFFSKPTGEEKGVFLAVDFGGTNVRVSLISLLGHGKIAVLKKRSTLLKDPGGSYDYTSSASTGRELFCFLARQIAGLAGTGGKFPLGLTFSFPAAMYGPDKAVLTGWTKEFKTGETVGRDVNLLLRDALREQGLAGIKPVAVINDTVGTLLTAAYGDPRADIGSICGTGHNTCYFEPQTPPQQGAMIINIESGNFDRLPLNKFDRQLDLNSEKPGEQVLEKMVSGRYLGELMRLVVLDLTHKGRLFQGRGSETHGFLKRPNSLRAEHISLVLADDPARPTGTAAWLKKDMGIEQATLEELGALQTIASLLTVRSARLVAATYAGVLRRLDPLTKKPHTIAVDGSLYGKMTGFKLFLQAGLNEILRDKAGQVTLKSTLDGSGMGAAVAAAIAASSKRQ